ncbi:putative peroxisomal enoyl-coa hydratase [Trypanosoma grayi]|uniref:putative peroxisomal enoyl-coa hydratase n=1 Tax=Trypanosoma grayi TaxID=71804 RepID=UPI0004F4481A|nr:putative peroxisomal enoyl-coa hydratase [Trypanosoma grayi]KEG07004.1 putative peroxisomal enoyl-coa hydratase [Trypanosoma grayi]
MLRRCWGCRSSFSLLANFEPFELYSYKDSGVCEIVASNKKNPLNLLDRSYFSSLMKVTHYLSSDLSGMARVAILTSKEGTPFSAGLDLNELRKLQQERATKTTHDETKDIVGKNSATQFQHQHVLVRFFQNSVSSLARCRIPIICAIDGHCIGGATSIITACDFRYATEKASFSVKEAQVGIAADLGVLQRLPGIVGEGRARELVYTARSFNGNEAKEMGLVEEVFTNRDEMMKSVRHAASIIAANSPLAVQGSKLLMNHRREPDVERSLEYTGAWSAANLSCGDVAEAAIAFAKKRPPHFKDHLLDPSSSMPRD